MPEKIIVAYKKLGQTPLECLNDLKISRPDLADLPLTYAGRLDPMAEGLMLVLVGDECKKKDQYLGLDKTYEFEILVGFSTDTYDLLGKAESENKGVRMVWPSFQKNSARRSEDLSNALFSDSAFVTTLESFVGTFRQKYPSFSSKTVDGKQLFQLALDDELPDELPEHEVTIYNLQCTSTVLQKKEDLEKEIIGRIALVKGDFRQEEIIKKWQEAFSQSNQKEFVVLSCVMDCSSGTYVRQLVADISEKVGIPLVTYSIKRTRVGEYVL